MPTRRRCSRSCAARRRRAAPLAPSADAALCRSRPRALWAAGAGPLDAAAPGAAERAVGAGRAGRRRPPRRACSPTSRRTPPPSPPPPRGSPAPASRARPSSRAARTAPGAALGRAVCGPQRIRRRSPTPSAGEPRLPSWRHRHRADRARAGPTAARPAALSRPAADRRGLAALGVGILLSAPRDTETCRPRLRRLAGDATMAAKGRSARNPDPPARHRRCARLERCSGSCVRSGGARAGGNFLNKGGEMAGKVQTHSGGLPFGHALPRREGRGQGDRLLQEGVRRAREVPHGRAGGTVAHAELEIGDSVIMLADEIRSTAP